MWQRMENWGCKERLVERGREKHFIREGGGRLRRSQRREKRKERGERGREEKRKKRRKGRMEKEGQEEMTE